MTSLFDDPIPDDEPDTDEDESLPGDDGDRDEQDSDSPPHLPELTPYEPLLHFYRGMGGE